MLETLLDQTSSELWEKFEQWAGFEKTKNFDIIAITYEEKNKARVRTTYRSPKKDEPVKHITAGSVIYIGAEDDQTISKDELLKLTIDAIRSMKNIAGEDSERFRKISNIPLEFECAYETICSLRDIKALKMSEQVLLDDDRIKKNIRYLQGRLLSDSSSLSVELYERKLSPKQHQKFMKRARTEIQLNVLIRDNLDIHRYYHLKKTQISIQWSEQALSTLPEFVELLLNLRNILVVNLSLLMQVPISERHRVEKNITVSSLRQEVPDEQNKKRQRRSKKTLGSIKHRKTAYF
ncbi:hypothetical protein G9A89_004944 [Geosiphon pyriformis]|nr:hypothetical protein G9A89_004944 [Geosiphon pyriformis]